MSPNRAEGWFPALAKKLALGLATSILLTLPTGGADKAKDEETLRNSTTVLKTMLDSKTVPRDLLARANCIIVLPDVKKAGFLVGGSGGRGAMSCRRGKDFSGSWSAPAMYTIGGASIGLQVGGSSTDFIVLVMSEKGVDAVLQGKTKFGNDATVAAGPAGATSSGTVGGSDMLTYGRAKGLFAGMSLGGATLSPDNDANQRLYGKAVTPKEIIVQNAVQITPAGQDLMSLFNSLGGRALSSSR
jgi:lipid-binding SYLF domain-containing protein